MLYEASVQDPAPHAHILVEIYRDLRGKFPRVLREDFCGTFAISAAWVERNRKNSAIGLDLDPEPIAYGMKTHYAALSAEQKKRINILKQNVMTVTRPGVDVIAACNFSFCIFKERALLVKYFKFVRQSLKKDGIFVMELAGGPGMEEQIKDRRTVDMRKSAIVSGKMNIERGLRPDPSKKFTYIWHQKSFEPISRNGHYSIDFKLPNGDLWKDAFTYDWRMWTIPEIRDVLMDAGFADTAVFWETEDKNGEPTGEYKRMKEGDNAHAWIAQVVASREKF